MVDKGFSVSDVFFYYKKKTKAVLDWLAIQNSPRKSSGPVWSFKDTREIVDCVKGLSTQYHIPSSVIADLREAIRARRKVHQMYKESHTSASELSDLDKDDTHETFIQRLELILQILISKRARPQKPNNENLSVPPLTAPSALDSNRFTPLGLNSATFGEDVAEEEYDHCAAEEGFPIQTKQERMENLKDFGFPLQDDELAIYVILGFLARIIDDCLEQTSKYWIGAANGDLPVCVAAWLTNALFSETDAWFGGINFGMLLSIWMDNPILRHGNDPGFEHKHTDIPNLVTTDASRFANLDVLAFYEPLLRNCSKPVAIEDWENNDACARSRKAGDILSWVKEKTNGNEKAFAREMLNQLRQVIALHSATLNVERIASKAPHLGSEPLIHMIENLSKGKYARSFIPLGIVYAMEISLVSSKMYLSSSDNGKQRNCRIMALQFALEVKNSCLGALEWMNSRKSLLKEYHVPHLLRVINGLETFIGEKNFGLYYQVPWISGCHMIFSLTHGTYLGLSLCFDTGYLCMILHLYNAITVVDPTFKPIKLLEQLCELFIDMLFLGVRPTGNFRSHYRRSTGSEIDWNERRDRAGQLKLSVPCFGVRAREDILKRFSMFMNWHKTRYNESAHTWYATFDSQQKSKPESDPNYEKDPNLVGSHDQFEAYNCLTERVMKEFSGPFPISRINYLALFVHIANCLEQFLGHSYAEISFLRAMDEPVEYAMVIIDSILEDLTKHMQDKKRGLPSRRTFKLARRFLDGLDKDLSLDKFYWESQL